MSLKYLPLIGTLALAAPAHAITINMSGFFFGSSINVDMIGTSGSPSYDGAAGEFLGGSTVTESLARPLSLLALPTDSSASFTAWCAELTQSFSFGTPYDYSQVSGSSYFGARSSDLSRLFTAAAQNHFLVDSRTSGALQAGIWEIIYEKGSSYSLTGGTFKGTAENPADQGALDTVNGYLTNLSSYHADYRIDVLANGIQQDFLVATIPEPESWALLAAGLGVIGLLRRRRAA